MVSYALLGIAVGKLCRQLSAAIEATPAVVAPASHSTPLEKRFGFHRSRQTVVKLAALFMLDAFAGGLVIQALMTYLIAARLAARFGLLKTLAWIHIPSNVLLMLVPLRPTFPFALTVLLGASASRRWMSPRANHTPWPLSIPMNVQQLRGLLPWPAPPAVPSPH